jgi:signal transduction histidine kinase
MNDASLPEQVRRLEAALTEAEARLERQEEFFQMAVHDLRSPLSAIVVYSELLMNRVLGDLSDRQVEQIGTIHRNCVQLIRMAEDVLASAQVRAGKIEIDFRSLDLRALCCEAVTGLEGLAQAKGIAVEVCPAPDLPLVPADQDKISRAFCNILGNAIKFSPAGGRITVELESDPDEVTISVTDEGPGISPEKRDSIFAKFQRGEHGGEKGHGLGLTIARYFIDLHGGRILVDSRRNRGSTFLLALPRKQPPT